MRTKLFIVAEVLVGIGAAATGLYVESEQIGMYVFLVGTAIVAILNYVTKPRL